MLDAVWEIFIIIKSPPSTYYITFHFKSKLMQYKSPQITDNNNTIWFLRRNVYMKATGIVRRIEECVIIGQTVWNPHKHKDFYKFALLNTRVSKTIFIHIKSEVYFTSLLRVLISLEKCSIMKKTVEYYLSGGWFYAIRSANLFSRI